MGMVHVVWASLYRNFVRKLPTTLVAPSLAPLALVKGELLASFFLMASCPFRLTPVTHSSATSWGPKPYTLTPKPYITPL